MRSSCVTSKLIRCQDEAAYPVAMRPTRWLRICFSSISIVSFARAKRLISEHKARHSCSSCQVERTTHKTSLFIMHLSTVLHLLTSLTVAITAQDLSTTSSQHPCNCLTDAQAKSYVADYAWIMAEKPNYRTVAEKRLKSDFKAYSDSYSYIFQHELNRTNTQTRDEHLAKHKNTPREWGFETLFLSHTCDTITWYAWNWMESKERLALPIRKMKIFFVDTKDGRFTKVCPE